jgi:hypothetical protein
MLLTINNIIDDYKFKIEKKDMLSKSLKNLNYFKGLYKVLI